VLNIASSFGSLVGIAINPLIGVVADNSPRLTVAGIAAVLLGIGLSWIPALNRYLPDRQHRADPDSDAD